MMLVDAGSFSRMWRFIHPCRMMITFRPIAIIKYSGFTGLMGWSTWKAFVYLIFGFDIA
jgi:hypothetical protein